MLTRLRTGLRNTAHDASAYTGALLHETTLRLAVTGLSRAGKTVFITSLLTNLLAMGRQRDTLPALQKRLVPEEGSAARLRSIRLVPPGSGETPVFDFTRNLSTLMGEGRHWPPRTDDITETAVELVLEHKGALKRRLGVQRLRLEVLDYPGEWLLDLPMLEQSFPAWSRETLARLRENSRRPIFAPFLEQLATADPDGVPEDAHLRRLHHFYRSALLAAQAEHGLRLLQPGRFLCPGPRAAAASVSSPT